MRKQKSGHIFQVSSVGGRLAVPGNTPYHAGPSGLWAVSAMHWRWKLRRFGVKICTLEPGGIRTNWARRAGQNAPDLLPDYEASVGSMLKMLRSLEGRSEGDPRKIADVIVQLANSDERAVAADPRCRMRNSECNKLKLRVAREAEKWRHLTVFNGF